MGQASKEETTAPESTAGQTTSITTTTTTIAETTTSAGTADPIALTNISSTQVENPRWSPDGKKIAFIRKSGPGNVPGEIYVVNADGTNEANLTNDPTANYVEPTWSADSKKIAFTKASSGGGPGASVERTFRQPTNSAIYVMTVPAT